MQPRGETEVRWQVLDAEGETSVESVSILSSVQEAAPEAARGLQRLQSGPVKALGQPLALQAVLGQIRPFLESKLSSHHFGVFNFMLLSYDSR
jgi:hypothetical protein